MKTTLNKIRSHSPCADGWEKLLKHLGKTKADDEPLDLLTILAAALAAAGDAADAAGAAARDAAWDAALEGAAKVCDGYAEAGVTGAMVCAAAIRAMKVEK